VIRHVKIYKVLFPPGKALGSWLHPVKLYKVFSIKEQLLRRNVKRFRGGLVFKAHRLVYHPTLGWRVIKKKKKIYKVLLPSGKSLGLWLHPVNSAC